MIQIDDKLISDEIVQELFACNLDKCKGECCVAGEFGAPLAEDELAILENIYQDVKPFLSAQGQAAIARQGTWVNDTQGDLSTPMIADGGPCAYTVFENGIALCGIEKAYRAGAVSWQKPVSCHLYPIRVTKKSFFEALNYDRWSICKSACGHGQEQKIRVFEFVKDGLIRKYGEDFYNQLAATADFMQGG